MVPPGADTPRGEVTEVTEDGTVEVDGVTYAPRGEGLEPGMDVYVTRRRGGEYVRPLAEHQREQERKERRRELKDRARERYQDWKHRRAREFWNQYSIPFQWDVAIKARLSGMTRDSWGDGRAADTVEHLYVREGFSEGRLTRDADRYLCDDSAEFRHTEGERRQNSDGEEYIPPVTCSRCLDLMDRWRTED